MRDEISQSGKIAFNIISERVKKWCRNVMEVHMSNIYSGTYCHPALVGVPGGPKIRKT